MCLICTGCGKCMESPDPATDNGKSWTVEDVLSEARRIGSSTLAVAEKIFASIEDDRAIREATSIYKLTDRFTEYQIEAACEFALGQIPEPRRRFIQAVLESGAAA